MAHMSVIDASAAPPKPRRFTVDAWDLLAVAGCGLLTVSGWLVHPALGLAVLGVASLAAAVLGSLTTKPKKP